MGETWQGFNFTLWIEGAAEVQGSAEGLMPNKYYGQPPNFRINKDEQ